MDDLFWSVMGAAPLYHDMSMMNLHSAWCIAPKPSWIGMWYWSNYWYAWYAWSAWYAWDAWLAWYAWYAWSAWGAWANNWNGNYVYTKVTITATLSNVTFDFGCYYGESFKLTHTITGGTLIVSGMLQITREGTD